MMSKNFPWTVREEIMCLLIYKELDEKGFPRGLRTKLCEEMSFKENTPLYSSINLKVANYESLFTEEKKGMHGGAKNPLTQLVYKNFKDYSIKNLKKFLKSNKIKDLCKKKLKPVNTAKRSLSLLETRKTLVQIRSANTPEKKELIFKKAKKKR